MSILRSCVKRGQFRWGGLLMAGIYLLVSASTVRPAPPQNSQGQDFGPEARLLYRVVACSGDAPLPATIDPAIVARHCQLLKPRMERYRRVYLSHAKPFLAALRPKGLPDTVIYP